MRWSLVYYRSTVCTVHELCIAIYYVYNMRGALTRIVSNKRSVRWVFLRCICKCCRTSPRRSYPRPTICRIRWTMTICRILWATIQKCRPTSASREIRREILGKPLQQSAPPAINKLINKINKPQT